MDGRKYIGDNRMNFMIKGSARSNGRQFEVFNSDGEFLASVGVKVASITGKEVISNSKGQTIYLVDSKHDGTTSKSTIYDASQELLSVFVSNTYSKVTIHISSARQSYKVSYNLDCSKLILYKNDNLLGTMEKKKSIFTTNYELETYDDNETCLTYTLALVISRLLQGKVENIMREAYAY